MDLIVLTHFGKRPRFAGWLVDENRLAFLGWLVDENCVALLPVVFPSFFVIPTPYMDTTQNYPFVLTENYRIFSALSAL